MNRILKTAILSAAVAATTFAALPAANAGDNWRRHRHYDNHSDGDLVAAGILGSATKVVEGLQHGLACLLKRAAHAGQVRWPRRLF